MMKNYAENVLFVLLFIAGVVLINCSDDSSADGHSDAGESDSEDTGSEPDSSFDVDPYSENFTRYTVSDTVEGVAYATVADVDRDGQLDILISSFGPRGTVFNPGLVTLFRFQGSLSNWMSEVIVGPEHGFYFPNKTTVDDVDDDGDMDILVAFGFFVCMFGDMDCGAIVWFEQDGASWIRHDVVPQSSPGFYHEARLADIDEDGVRDLVTVVEDRVLVDPSDTVNGWSSTATPLWFKGEATAARFETTPRAIGLGLGSYPSTHDIDGDGDLDLASAEFFLEKQFDSYGFAWMEQLEPPSADNPPGRWTRHVIADHLGPAIQFSFVENLFGDSKLRAVGSVHVMPYDISGLEAALYVFEIPSDPSLPWPAKKISEGITASGEQGEDYAPGVFGWGDIDGDGDIDIVASGDGDPRVFVFVQGANHEFETHFIENPLGQASGMVVTDLDKDGASEIVVTGYEDYVVYVYEWVGGNGN